MTAETMTKIILYLLAAGVIGFGLFVLLPVAIQAYRKLKNRVESKTAAQDPDPVQAEAAQAIGNLAAILAEAEKDSNRASLLLIDAQTYAQSLVNLVQGIALKAEQMTQEADVLGEALAAIATHDPLKIARAGGLVKDEQIRTLLLCKVRNLDYWQDTAILISAQIGTLQQWERGYRTFASNLLSEVSKAKAQLSALSAALELTGASRPLLQIQESLGQATERLQLERRPGLYKAAKELPAINAGLLLK